MSLLITIGLSVFMASSIYILHTENEREYQKYLEKERGKRILAIHNTTKIQPYMISNILQYLTECYHSDTRANYILDILKADYQYKYYLEEEILINRHSGSAPIDFEEAQKIYKDAFTYRKEKELIYSSCFICGNIKDGDPRNARIVAPLFIYEVSLDIDRYTEQASISIVPENPRINFGLINTIYQETDKAIAVYDKIHRNLEEESFVLTKKSIRNMCRLMEGDGVQIDYDSFTLFPNLLQHNNLMTQLDAAFSKKAGQFSLLNAGIFCLSNKAASSRGILDEMQTIARSRQYSQALKALFLLATKWQSFRDRRPGLTPSILSNAQQKILDAVRKFSINVVIGPPGTGKSYTIAAIALEYISRGKTVLIASKMDQAVDVIADKIIQQSGRDDFVVRAGKQHYLKKLSSYLDNLLNGVISLPQSSPLAQRAHFKSILSRMNSILRLEKEFGKEVKKELAAGAFLSLWKKNLVPKTGWNRHKKNMIEKYNYHAEVLMDLIDRLEDKLHQNLAHISQYIYSAVMSQIMALLNTYRKELSAYRKALGADTESHKEDLFRLIDFQNMLKAFPIWIVNLSDMYRALPLQRELFDLVIIDEATTCDMASCIPAMYRARNSLIVGDPYQLRHISFLSRRMQKTLADRYHLSQAEHDVYDYRNKSILDIVNDMIPHQKQILFLDEHYRSLPDIIQFSNQMIYNNSLRIMTRKPHLTKDSPLEIIPCKGKKQENGLNQEEAREILRRVKTIIKEQKKLPARLSQSIGILSPFRDQADHITRTLNKELTVWELEKHNIMIGTAHTFQGEERDLMFLSLCVDDKSHRNNFAFISKSDILNVSITRARVKECICVSLKTSSLEQGSMIRRFLEYCESRIQQYRDGISNEQISNDDFQKEVSEALSSLGYACYPGYKIAGLEIDLVVASDDRSIGIDLLGFPGIYENAFSMEKYKMYFRAGLEMVPLEYSRWMFEKQKMINKLVKKLTQDSSEK